MRADISEDGIVDLADFANTAQYWLSSCYNCGSDLNGDSQVDILDLMAMVDQWLIVENKGCRIADMNDDDRVNLADWAVFAQHWMEGM